MKFLLLAILLTGCAETRYLTKDEDAALRADCQPVGGCVYMPGTVWEQIKAVLKGGTRI